MLIKIISYLPAILGVVTVGFFVLLNNPKNVKNRTFAAANFAIALWLSFLFLGDVSTSEAVGIWFLRFALFFGQLMFLFFYLFSLVFPFTSRITKSGITFFSVIAGLFSILLLTPLGVKSVSIHDFGIQPENIGPLYAVSDIIGLAYLLLGGAALVVKYRKSNLQQKSQIKFVLFGLSITLFVNIVTGVILTLLKIDTEFILFGSFSIFVFSIFVGYAIVRHGFLDIRSIVAKSVAYVALLVSLGTLYGAVVFGLANLFIEQDSSSTGIRAFYLIVAVLIAFTLQPLKRFFDRLSNRIFFQDAYDPQLFLDKLSNILVSTIDLSKLLHDSADLVSDTLKSSYIKFLLIDKDNIRNVRVLGHAVNVLDKTEAKELTAFLDKIEKKVIVTEDDMGSLHEKGMMELMQEHNIGVVLRLVTHQQRVGYILVGIKRSGSPYTKEDVRLFEITADELSLAIQNALRFEEIENFNVTLQGRITDATRELKRSNEKLKALDEAKDEFISMASHQLRTPLTSVKGYVSMVLDGDAGKVSKQQKELLGQSYASAQRMVYLISDLLNVSRLKTGKFVIEPKPICLPDVIEEELEQVKEMASVKSITLKYNKPHDFPMVELDDTKIRQVIMNFIDNAIHYTPNNGEVTISLAKSDRQFEFLVVDNGIGVPKSEQHHLFTKFYRAGNAKKARPDGTGLGLFMAKKVIVASGGALIFRSQEGKGSTFGFSFPLKTTHQSDN